MFLFLLIYREQIFLPFLTSDPCQILLDVVRESGLARDLFQIEITESTVISDPERMKKEIDRFHQHGFQVLMDDFGSGYSSLNTLRDFDFDEIKIDMGFMKSFGDRSKKILKPIISMTKSLGIHTLTEGVETQEQLEFLKEIGCEQIQGFYYGKPDPLFQMYASLGEKDIVSENREEIALFNKIGLVDVITDVPTALYYFNGNIFDIYYMNTNYRNILTGDSYPFHKPMDEMMNSEKSLSRDSFLSVARAAMHSGKEERFTSIYQGRYYLFTCQMIARNSHGVMFKSTLNDFRENESIRISDKMDQSIRTILLAYESVYLIDLDKDSREVIQSNILGEKAGDKVYHLYEFYQNYMVREIYPDDRERFEDFIDPFTWQPLLQKKGKYSDIFRYKREDGRTVYMEILLIAIPNSDNNQILICIKPAGFTNEEMDQVLRIISWKHDYHVQINEYSQNDDGILWHNLMRFSNLKMYVLDDQQKILGISEKFREYFAIRSRDSLIGKSAKELSFLLDSAQCTEDNNIVLTQGKSISPTMVKVVVNGIIKQLVLTKFPVHHNGKISGIIGYVNEIDPSINSADYFHHMKTMDKVTGFFNEMGMLTTSIDYHENYKVSKEIYYISMIDFLDFERISQDYGKSIGEKLLQTIAKVIREAYPADAVFCRVHGAHFVIYQKINSINLARKNIQTAIRNLCGIRNVEEYPCTLYPRFCLSKCTEEDSAIELYQLCLTRLK